ncbi:MAG TPA: tungstate ABC transporter substrate-binding protein WtpA, partial [Candidatus Bathyarchaeota archaeon]|nr:tungstate ABC transporter substrate-binding protein WtpA [Candidatus Bathyarchaeota archaeon]
MKRWTYAAITIVIVVAAAVGFWTWRAEQTEKLIVFHAGSLTKVVEDMGAALSGEYGIRVVNEPSGSVDAVRKVTDLGRSCDVLMVADYRLVKDMMFDGYADWVLVFASNEMVLAYTDKSLYADEVSSENWLEILLRDEVRVGFADPNRDPCGYRAIMVLALASIHYGTEEPLRMLEDHASVTYVDNGTSVLIDATELQPDSVKVFVREKSVDLVSLLEAGVLDYAFEYRNVAQAKGLRFVELPDEVNLANPDMDD